MTAPPTAPDPAELDPDRAGVAVEALEAVDDPQGWASRLALLGDPNRLRILLAVHSAPGITVGMLAQTVRMSENTTSHALAALRTAGLVAVHRDGRFRRWSICDERTHRLLHVIGAAHSDLHGTNDH